MAYDRYDSRREGPSNYADERHRRNWDRDRHDRHERGERGFFERASDEIASWFGDDDHGRRSRRDERGYGRDRADDGWLSSGRGRDYDRDHDRERSYGERIYGERNRGRSDEGGRFMGRDDRQGMTGRWRDRDDDRSHGSSGWSSRSDRDDRDERSTGASSGYRPMAGDYGRSGGYSDRDDYSRTSFAGSAARGNEDRPYSEWRRRRMEEMDRDYDDYRRENQSRFENDFGEWRQRRTGKRQMLGKIREHMEVVGSDGEHVGTVDKVAGDRVILTKSDKDSGGSHHSITCTLIDRVEDDRVMLEVDAGRARERWVDEDHDRALFERDDQGQAGPGMLNRSFSGTYR